MYSQNKGSNFKHSLFYKMTYKEKLKDPRWLEKRSKIIDRDGGKCVCCGSKRELHVHHIKYFGNPWEVKDSSLVTLCRSCHVQEESYRKSCFSLLSLSKETNIPCVVLADILHSLDKLKINQVPYLIESIDRFLKKDSIKSKNYVNAMGGIGGRIRHNVKPAQFKGWSRVTSSDMFYGIRFLN